MNRFILNARIDRFIKSKNYQQKELDLMSEDDFFQLINILGVAHLFSEEEAFSNFVNSHILAYLGFREALVYAIEIAELKAARKKKAAEVVEV